MQDDTKTRYDHGPPIAADQLRILTLKPGEHEAEIQCELKTFPRSDKPVYTALSYYWGKPDQGTEDIKIEGKTLSIQNELAIALRHLRKSDASLRLWADAICIIQAGEFEKQDKDSQLDNMDLIYTEAASVVVWLGKSSEEDESWLAMAAIDLLGSQLDDYVLGEVPKATLMLSLVAGCEPKQYIKAIGKLLNRSWFHRLWVSIIIYHLYEMVTC